MRIYFDYRWIIVGAIRPKEQEEWGSMLLDNDFLAKEPNFWIEIYFCKQKIFHSLKCKTRFFPGS